MQIQPYEERLQKYHPRKNGFKNTTLERTVAKYNPTNPTLESTITKNTTLESKPSTLRPSYL
jgi:hypothetical protein